MKESNYKSYDELPLFLNAATVAKVLGVSPSSGYELMHEADFPVLKIGNKCVILKEKFVEWVSRHTQYKPYRTPTKVLQNYYNHRKCRHDTQ